MLAGMQILDVEGATGNYDTNFQGKADAALSALLSGLDLVYIHMEAPDECGHQGDVKHKIFSIEEIDRAVVGTLVKGLNDAKSPSACSYVPTTPRQSVSARIPPIPFPIFYTTAKRSFRGRSALRRGTRRGDGRFRRGRIPSHAKTFEQIEKRKPVGFLLLFFSGRSRRSWRVRARSDRSRRSPPNSCSASKNPKPSPPARDNIFRKFPDIKGSPS